ncbi:MAG: hypothetical protein JW991_00540 [Candidatus Pacebacteria bacterium]|nr:hypothetical protein [Candidatus Paceibacterota bacterium]
MSKKIKDSPVVQTAKTNIFFRDFLAFLRLLEKRPLELTQTGTGNLKVKEIRVLGKLFKHDIYHRDEKGEVMFQPRTEDEFRYIMVIRQLAQVMYLVYKRKGKLFLSKNGKGYLNNIDEKTQYEQMILWYFHRANWAYVHPRAEVVEKIQENQEQIWAYLLRASDWIKFSQFAKSLSLVLKLSIKDIYGQEMPESVRWAIESILVENLEELGLVESKKRKSKYGSQRTYLFRPTATGRIIFKKALEPF